MRTVCKFFIALWSIFCFVGLMIGINNVADLQNNNPFAEIGIAFGVMFWIMLWFFPTVGLGIIALLCKPESDKVLKKIKKENIPPDERLKRLRTKKSPGVATVLSFLYCGLGQIYNGQILSGIVYMSFYGISIGSIIAFSFSGVCSSSNPLPGFFILFGFFLWIVGMVNANKTAKRINIRLAYLKQKGDLKTKEKNLCLDCWLSGDCDREKEAIKRREIIISCKGYVPENK